MDKSDIYLQRKIGELERRIEKLEAQLIAYTTNPVNTGEYYTVPQMAKALNVSPLTVRRKIQSGQITAQKIGKYWKIPKTELDQIFD
jgi:excisionase family DNA binding protein